MFEDFDSKNTRKDARRFGASLAVSTLVYLGLGGGIVAASAAARSAVQDDDLVQVDFQPPPEPEPPPPPPPPPPPAKSAPPPSPRPKVERTELETPEEVPDQKPEESDKELADAPDPNAGRDGFSDGVAGGTGTAPAPAVVPVAPPAPAPRPSGPIQLPEQATPAVADAGNRAPEYPESARKAGVQAVVVAKIVIHSDGRVTSVEILRGPEVFHASVKAALSSWRYAPARLPDGTAISVFRIVTLPFKLENM